VTLLERALQSKNPLTSREERKIKRAFSAELEAQSIARAETIADTLVDMGIYDDITPFIPLFQDEHSTSIMQAAYNIAVQQHNSANIVTAVERAAKIVFAMKSYSRFDYSGEKTEARITEGIEVALTLHHNQLKHGITVIKHYQDVPLIVCYPDELSQVWTNLIHNAIWAMNGQGTLEIAVYPALAPSPTSPRPSPIGEGEREGWVVVQITDSGCGIPLEIKDRIFEPFFTTKPTGEGSGLGLDICRKIIEKHQGTIEVESQPGRTTFKVFLPIV
jgi:signal transduction histidine kinase